MKPDLDTVRAGLQDCLRETFFDDGIEIFDEMTADDVDGWDSLAHVRLLMHVERRFGVTMTDEAAERVANVGALARLIHDRAA